MKQHLLNNMAKREGNQYTRGIAQQQRKLVAVTRKCMV